MPYCLPRAGERTDRFMPFLKALARKKMQTALFEIELVLPIPLLTTITVTQKA